MGPEQVAKRYGRGRPWVIREVDLTLSPGGMTVVSGANGSGKSTLLRIIGGSSGPTRGTVAGRPPKVAVVPDRLVLPARMTGPRTLSITGACMG